VAQLQERYDDDGDDDNNNNNNNNNNKLTPHYGAMNRFLVDPGNLAFKKYIKYQGFKNFTK